MMRCKSCRHVHVGGTACPQCGEFLHHDLDLFAGLIVRGETYAHREQIKAAGGVYDEYRKEWVIPRGITSEQFDALDAVLKNPALRTGYYENPADYDAGPRPELAH